MQDRTSGQLQEIVRRAQMLLDAVCDYEMIGYPPVSSGAELNAVAAIRDHAQCRLDVKALVQAVLVEKMTVHP